MPCRLCLLPSVLQDSHFLGFLVLTPSCASADAVSSPLGTDACALF